MINELEIYNITRALIKGPSKDTPSSWLSFNAPCCPHVDSSHRPDRLKRGGLRLTSNGVVFHCFNCGFSTGWRMGINLPRKFQSLLKWMGLDENSISKLSLDIWSQNKDSGVTNSYASAFKEQYKELNFPPHLLPVNSQPIFESINQSLDVDNIEKLKYLDSRGKFALDNIHRFYSTNSKKDTMNRRIIIPFEWEDSIVGYVGRTVDDIKPKYFGYIPKDFIFNTSCIKKEHQYIIVVEGPFDAIAVNGISLLGNKCSNNQATWISRLNKEIIVVPDRDGKKSYLEEKAREMGWYVSRPEWNDKIKDCADAACNFGQLYTIKSIMDAKRRI